jgi:hypothetical protein
MQMPNITPFLRILWNDEMDVYKTHEESHRGEISNVYDNTPTLTSVQCQISFSSSNFDKPVDENVLKEGILNTATIFCETSVDVNPGDKLKIRRKSNGVVFEEYAGLVIKSGLPNKRFSHQEILVNLEGDA